MEILTILVYAIAIAWFSFRIFWMKQVFFWDWTDGKFQFFWNKDKWKYENMG